jgi:hypothetical protein
MTKDTKGPNKDNQGLDMVALLISSNHMVNLILYHHCIRDVISLVVVPFFRGRSCTIKFHILNSLSGEWLSLLQDLGDLLSLSDY